MIVGYLRDALEGEDRPYAAQFLTRRAPLGFWLKYYLAKLRTCVAGESGGRRVAGSEAIQWRRLAREPLEEASYLQRGEEDPCQPWLFLIEARKDLTRIGLNRAVYVAGKLQLIVLRHRSLTS